MRMKYMLAILCSKPAATNAETGKTIASTLSTTLRPASAIHNARHTRMLHSTPLKNADQKESAHFAAAIFTYCNATALLLISGWPDWETRSASPAAPAKL